MENDTIYLSENEYFPNYDLEIKYDRKKVFLYLQKRVSLY